MVVIYLKGERTGKRFETAVGVRFSDEMRRRPAPQDMVRLIDREGEVVAQFPVGDVLAYHVV